MANRIFPLLFCWFAVLAHQLTAQTTIVEFNFTEDGVLPSATKDVFYSSSTNANESSIYSVAAGYLQQTSFSISGNHSYHYPAVGKVGGSLDSSKSTLMEARIQVSDINSANQDIGGHGIYMQCSDGSFEYGLYFTENGVNLRTPIPGESVPVDVDHDHQQFHLYQVYSPPNSSEIFLFIDGTLRATSQARISDSNGVSFGDGWTLSGNGATANWDYFRLVQNVAMPKNRPSSAKTHVLGIGIRDTNVKTSGKIGSDSGTRVANAFAAFPNTICHFLELDDSNFDNMAQITNRLTNIRESMNEGDSLIFYLNTHGGFRDPILGGDEAPVLAQNNPSDLLQREPTTGDEYLYISVAERWEDDEFSQFFSSAEWMGINKLFILDCCYSGGFWNVDTSLGDSGDLASLERSALLAASTEANFSWNARFYQDSTDLYGTLGIAVTEVLQQQNVAEILAFEDLVVEIQQTFNLRMTQLVNSEPFPEPYNTNITSVYISGGVDEGVWGQELNNDEITNEPIVATATKDFDLELGSLLGDVNLDGVINLLDVEAFIGVLESGQFQFEADTNSDGVVNLLDVAPFVQILANG